MSATHDFAGIAANNDVKTVDDFAPQSWEDCDDFATAHRASYSGYLSQEHIVGSNVNLLWDGREKYYAIVLYDTEIVRYYPDGTFSVDNGGFNTQTTSARVNQFTPDNARFWHDQKILVLVNCEEFGLERTHRRHSTGLLRCNHDVRIPCRRVV